MGTAEPPSSARRLYAGVDVGKAHHWVCLVDEQGRVVLSRKVANEETDLTAVVQEVTAAGVAVTWAVDIVDTLSVLLLALLTVAGQDVRYVAGRVVNSHEHRLRRGGQDRREGRVRHRGDRPGPPRPAGRGGCHGQRAGADAADREAGGPGR